MSDTASSSSIPELPSSRNSASIVVKALTGWLLLWFAGLVAAGAVVSMPYYPQKPPLQLIMLVSLIVSPGLLFWITYRRTRFDRARLGLNPIKRQWLLALFSVLLLAYVPVYYWLFGQPLPYHGIDTHHWFWTGIGMFVSIIIVTPIAEELLFRGWLWSDLGKYWPAAGTMLFTGTAFWVVHALDSWQRLLSLVLPTVVFTLSRRHCDSVKASIALHILNNAAVIAVLMYVVISGTPSPVVVHVPPHAPMP